MERQFLADRTALAFAAYAAGEEITLPSWEEELFAFDQALDAQPAVLTPRDVDNDFWRRELGVA